MTPRQWLLMLVLFIIVMLFVGCAPDADYSARFVRYEMIDGRSVAIVTPVAQPDDLQSAYTDIKDLEPNEIVSIRATGRSWDQPQSAPEREIVERMGK